MDKLFSIKPLWAFGIFALLDLICVGMGMGVPIFCILLGFLVGWYIVRIITLTTSSTSQVFRKVLLYASVTSAFTLFVMLIIWAPFATYYFDPAQDLTQTGIPMIFFEPRASFVGWIILMILISPFLQLLTTSFGAYLTLLNWSEKGGMVIAPSSTKYDRSG